MSSKYSNGNYPSAPFNSQISSNHQYGSTNYNANHEDNVDCCNCGFESKDCRLLIWTLWTFCYWLIILAIGYGK